MRGAQLLRATTVSVGWRHAPLPYLAIRRGSSGKGNKVMGQRGLSTRCGISRIGPYISGLGHDGDGVNQADNEGAESSLQGLSVNILHTTRTLRGTRWESLWTLSYVVSPRALLSRLI